MPGIPSRTTIESRHTPANPAAVPRSAGVSSPVRTGGTFSVGFAALLIFLFLAYSRVSDIFLNPLRLPLVTSVIALLALVLAGGSFSAVSSKTGRWLTAFTVWLVVTVPFSYWPGGSVQLITDHWAKSFLVFVIVGGLLQSVKQCRIAMYTVGCAVIATTVLAFVYGTNAMAGRLALHQGVLANPNDLAQILLLGLPFLWLIGATGSTLPTKALVGISTLSVLVVTLRTGSRGGIIGMCALLGVMLLTSTWGRRMKIAIVLILTTLAVLPFISQEQLARYSTIFSDDAQTLDDAVGSTQARLQLLRQSIELTFRHPVFGIGPGMFQVAQAEVSATVGERGIWHESHNTYTQVSSETGLPGFVFYLATLMTCLRTSRSLHNHARSSHASSAVADSSYYLWLSLIIFAVTTFFSSVAYHMYLPMLAGMTVALNRCAMVELELVGNVPRRAIGHRLGGLSPKGIREPRPVVT